MNTTNKKKYQRSYKNIFDLVCNKDFKVCITCNSYETCRNSQHYLDFCDNFKYEDNIDNPFDTVDRPKEKMLISAKLQYGNSNSIKIECINDDVNVFVKQVGLIYGQMTRNTSIDSSIYYYTLFVSDIYDTQEVLDYLHRANEIFMTYV